MPNILLLAPTAKSFLIRNMYENPTFRSPKSLTCQYRIDIGPIVVAWIVQQIPQSVPHSILSVETPVVICVFFSVFFCVSHCVLSRVLLLRRTYIAYDSTCGLDETNTVRN